MDTPQPGHFWKTPFFWTPGCKPPEPVAQLTFHAAELDWLEDAIAVVMETSPDESDRAALTELGSAGASRELLAVDTDHFELRPDWWACARDSAGEPVGFVLPVLLRPQRYWKEGKSQGTIYYMGVLPASRGKGYAAELLAQATRLLIAADCWRIFCDTSSHNEPMLKAFRRAGYEERTPWQRPLR